MFLPNEYLSRISSGIYNGMTGGIDAEGAGEEDLADARADSWTIPASPTW